MVQLFPIVGVKRGEKERTENHRRSVSHKLRSVSSLMEQKWTRIHFSVQRRAKC